MTTAINPNLKVINEAGLKTELAFDTLKKQLGAMIEAAITWTHEADLQKRLFEAGVIDADEYDKRCNSLRLGPGEGPSAPFEEVYKDAELCLPLNSAQYLHQRASRISQHSACWQ